MTGNDELLEAGTDADPAVGLRAVAALQRLTGQLEFLQVRRARQLGWSWSDIAAALGISKQAAHKKFAARLGSDNS